MKPDLQLAVQRGVPRSTAQGWLCPSRREVVTLDVLDTTEKQLQHEVLILRGRNENLRAALRVFIAVLRLSGFSLADCRIVDSEKKAKLLRAVERARSSLSLRVALHLLRVTPGRYHSWKRSEATCDLDARSSCPKTSPHQLTPSEVHTIRDMVTSPDNRHVPTGTLAVLAGRLGKVLASASTWYRLVRQHGWRRPRLRIHPAKPKMGLRATRANEFWHIDVTVIRLLDNTKAYVHAVIDNYSRRILAWRVSSRLEPGNTVAVLLEAAGVAEGSTIPPTFVADSGVENVNGKVDEIIESGILKRVLAMTEISFSNSLIEAWWRALKHQWLYLNSLDTVSSLTRFVRFYVGEHNARLPHSAFSGQTPDEMYFGTGDHVPNELENSRKASRQSRLKANRALFCRVCETEEPGIPESHGAAR